MIRQSLRPIHTTFFLLLAAFVSPEPVVGQLQDLLGQGALDGGLPGLDQSTINIDVVLVAEQLEAGQTAVLAVTATLPPGFYIYSTDPSFGGHTDIRLKTTEPLIPIDVDWQTDRKPKIVDDPNLKQTVQKFYSDVTWFRRYRIPDDADLSSIAIAGEMEGQYCSEDPEIGRCIPIRPPFEFNAALSEGKAPEIIQPVLEQLASAAPSATGFTYTVKPEIKKGRPGAIEWSFRLNRKNAGPGDEVELEMTARLDPGFHVFATTQDPEMAGQPTQFDLKGIGLTPIGSGPSASRTPEIYEPLDDIMQQVYHEQVTWTQTFTVDKDRKQGDYQIAGSVSYQTCNDTLCHPVATLNFRLGKPSGLPEMNLATSDGSEVGATRGAEQSSATLDTKGKRLGAFLLVAVLSGFAALLTPCVFPMVPITVSLFLKQAEKEHHRPVLTATVYCLGIVVSFTGLGLMMAALFGATSINELANNGWLNLAIAGVLVFFGANLLGLFEIRVPSFLLTWSAGREGKGGILGVLFMAFTFTLVSFTCTFAFAGGLLVVAARGDFFWPVLGMLAFSAAFATPFFFLALFPSMLQKLPKSGGWMNTIKVSMGMIEIAAALKFLSVTDLSWNPQPVIFDFSFTMAAWIMLSGALGLYLLGMFRLSHDSPSETISVPRFGFAMFFLVFAAYLAIGVFGREEPKGFVWEQIRVFAPPVLEGGERQDIGPFIEHEGITFALNFDQAKAYAESKNLPLFLDFTGVNCVNCRQMERRMTEPANRSLLDNFVRVQLYTDRVPQITDEALASELLEKNRRLQEDWFADVTLPSYAVVTPDGETLLASFKGLERRKGDFAQFLEEGLNRWGQDGSLSKLASRKIGNGSVSSVTNLQSSTD